MSRKPKATIAPPAPAKPVIAMSPTEVAQQTQSWDQAREQLKLVVEKVVAAQAAIDGLGADATDDQRNDALARLAEAENETHDAEAAIARLTPAEGATQADGATLSPKEVAIAKLTLAMDGNHADGVTLSGEEAAALGLQVKTSPDGALVSSISTERFTLSAAAGDDERVHALDLIGEIDRVAQGEIDEVLASVRAVAASGDVEGALAHLAEQRSGAAAMIRLATQIDAAFALEEIALRRSAVCWPLTQIKYDGQYPPIGEPLRIEPDVLVGLLAAGAVSDHPPTEIAADA